MCYPSLAFCGRYAFIVGALLILLTALYFKDDFQEESLKGKRVIITGASAGIGEQLAYQFAHFGAHVFVTSRRESVLKEVTERCRQLGQSQGQYHYLAGDMSDALFYPRLIETAVAKLGGIDFLVLNHMAESPIGEWLGTSKNLSLIHNMFEINVFSYIHLASLALPHLEQSNGSLVVMSSILGKVSQMFDVAYSSTKFALNGFFSGLRHELAFKHSNVSVTICTIGLTGTESAINKIKSSRLANVLKVVSPGKPEDAALAILKGSAGRHRDVYFPYMEARWGSIAAQLFPQTIEYLDSFIYNQA